MSFCLFPPRSGPIKYVFPHHVGHLPWRDATDADVKKWPTLGIVQNLDPVSTIGIPGIDKKKKKGVIHASVKVQICTEPGPQMLVTTNGVPNYMPATDTEAKPGDRGLTDAGKWYKVRAKNGRLDKNPNVIGEQNYKFVVPLEPKVFDPPKGELPFPTPMGPMAVASNGVPIYNAFANAGEDGVDLEAFDSCCGHPDGGSRSISGVWTSNRCTRAREHLGRTVEASG